MWKHNPYSRREIKAGSQTLGVRVCQHDGFVRETVKLRYKTATLQPSDSQRLTPKKMFTVSAVQLREISALLYCCYADVPVSFIC